MSRLLHFLFGNSLVNHLVLYFVITTSFSLEYHLLSQTYWSTLVIQTVACSEVIYFQHSLHRQTWLLVGSHAAPPPFGAVFLHFVLTADSFTSFRSQLKTYMFARHL